MATKIKKYFNNFKNIRKYNNLVDAAHTTVFLKKIFGAAVFQYKSKLGSTIESKFTFFGLVCFLCWYSLYFYCAVYAYCEDQSILRLLYDTKLKQYGDDYERAATIIFVLYAMWKLAFNLNRNTEYVQYNADIDKIIASLGQPIDYNKNGIIVLFISLSHLLVFSARCLCMWLTIGHMDMVVPYERMFQVVYSDVVAFMLAGYYCYCVSNLRERFAMINRTLDEIKTQKWEYTMFVNRKPTEIDKTMDVQEQYICKKIKTCATIHCMLYKTTKILNNIFCFAIMVTMFFGFNTVVLYMFYFMEATASGLFHDLLRYVYFLIYIFWQIAYATGIIYIIVYFSENTVQVVSRHQESYREHFVYCL